MSRENSKKGSNRQYKKYDDLNWFFAIKAGVKGIDLQYVPIELDLDLSKPINELEEQINQLVGRIDEALDYARGLIVYGLSPYSLIPWDNIQEERSIEEVKDAIRKTAINAALFIQQYEEALAAGDEKLLYSIVSDAFDNEFYMMQDLLSALTIHETAIVNADTLSTLVKFLSASEDDEVYNYYKEAQKLVEETGIVFSDDIIKAAKAQGNTRVKKTD